MSWTNDLFYGLLLTGIEGGLAYGLWLFAKSCLVRRNCYKYIYPTLWLVLFFFFVPVMFLYLRGGTIDLSNPEIYKGPIFMDTPFLSACKHTAMILWTIGAFFYFGSYWKAHRKYRWMMKQNIVCKQYQNAAKQIQKELHIKKDVEIYQNYAVASPFVTGWRSKKIVLPVRAYNDCEIETILYHELTHIRQRVLLMKHLGVIVRILYWWNPAANNLLRNIDRWGEVACDLSVCHETKYSYSPAVYYGVAVDALKESSIWLFGCVAGFKKGNDLKERIICMKNYRKENDLKKMGAVLLGAVLCFACTTTIYAAGQGVQEGYTKLYNDTVIAVEAEAEIPQQIYEGTMDSDNENIVWIENSLDVSSSGAREFSKVKIAKNSTAIVATLSLQKDDDVYVSLKITPTDKTVQYGLIDKNGNTSYVSGKGKCHNTFTAKKTGIYRVYIKNSGDESVEVSGSCFVGL